ncbi:cytochrome c maturation protein CcmE [Chloroflexota bacterium]
MFRRKRFLVGGLIIVLAITCLAITSFKDSATYYLTVSEFVAQEQLTNGENVRVNGQVAAGSVEQDIKDRILRFTIVGLEGEDSLPVVYHGVVPDTFKVGSEVVIEGHLNSTGIFQASNILTKCPSKYVPEK